MKEMADSPYNSRNQDPKAHWFLWSNPRGVIPYDDYVKDGEQEEV